jgi:hypothetical protein
VRGPGFRAQGPVRQGLWTVRGRGPIPATLEVRSAAGGVARWTGPAGPHAPAPLLAAAPLEAATAPEAASDADSTRPRRARRGPRP